MNPAFAAKIPKWLTVDWLKSAIILLLMLWMASRLAALFWVSMNTLFFKDAEIVPTLINDASTSSATSSRVSLDVLKDVHIFGDGDKDAKGLATEAPEPTAQATGEVPNEAPVTSLPLSLTGVVSGGDSRFSTAMIKHQSAEDSFHVDDKLPPSQQAVLRKIFPDRVIISNAGRYESILLYDNKKPNAALASERVSSAAATDASKTAQAKAGVKKASPNTASSAADVDETKRAEALDRIKTMVAAKDAQGLSKIINVTVAQGSSGQIKGYKVFPGKEKELFNSLGLQRGDIITSINGSDLSDPQKASAAMAQLSNGGRVNLTIEQNGEERELSLDL